VASFPSFPQWGRMMVEFTNYLAREGLLTVSTFTGTLRLQGQLGLTHHCGRRYFKVVIMSRMTTVFHRHKFLKDMCRRNFDVRCKIDHFHWAFHLPKRLFRMRVTIPPSLTVSRSRNNLITGAYLHSRTLDFSKVSNFDFHVACITIAYAHELQVC